MKYFLFILNLEKLKELINQFKIISIFIFGVFLLQIIIIKTQLQVQYYLQQQKLYFRFFDNQKSIQSVKKLFINFNSLLLKLNNIKWNIRNVSQIQPYQQCYAIVLFNLLKIMTLLINKTFSSTKLMLLQEKTVKYAMIINRLVSMFALIIVMSMMVVIQTITCLISNFAVEKVADSLQIIQNYQIVQIHLQIYLQYYYQL
ncbi:transmembrane protein, putative (macronuclear) [Tetrahymena thermophila SB210]|uniref:Transmembrane protein, putative n=1 Tax=Tetrahymena thermophila (strain SB210) TaxID=312017 RepID=W7XBI3_TETTS|nr:transmembrane protein, putative [Tetrahymena thermophila SB210]EWS76745.1 transmembrane protein, putative [Tetrahymena thermophila SB210]|eukprot:XP_012650738.1 transmembrane protein, putative [Tetrahymena thermophila SB210]